MVSTFYPPHVGGIEYHVENLSRELSKRGHDITVLTSALSNLPSITSFSDGIKVVRVKTSFPLGAIYPPISNQRFVFNIDDTIKQLIKNKQIDIVHVHGHHYYFTWRAITVAKKLGVPSILTLHGLCALNRCNAIAKIGEEIFNRTIFSRELKEVSAVIGLTPNVADYAKKYSFVASCFTVPNGVNYKLYDNNIGKKIRYRQKYNIGLDKIVILFIGRFTSVKGIIELAEAAKSVIKRNNNAYFIFVGGGPLLSTLARVLRPIEAYSKIIGWMPQEKIHELYIASNLFVLPSKSEALPLTILEAMAARLNIIATSVGGIPEVLNKYPCKTIINDCCPSDISRAILRAADDEIYNEHKFRNGYMNNFNWEVIASRIEEIYTSLNCHGSSNGLKFLPNDFHHVKVPNE